MVFSVQIKTFCAVGKFPVKYLKILIVSISGLLEVYGKKSGFILVNSSFIFEFLNNSL